MDTVLARMSDRRSGICVRPGAGQAHRQAPGQAELSLRRFIADAGGKVRALVSALSCACRLEEREEISRGWRRADSIRAIAEGLAAHLRRCAGRSMPTAGRKKYLALVADRAACRRALRPKRAKLAECRRLRGVVERRLEAKWSPEQISAWLASEYPDRPEMQVSHETIYQSLFVQSRGALRKELHSCLRTGRAMRRAKAYTKGNARPGKIKNMVMISERPAEVKDRPCPGHWEGDLIFGKKMTSIGTLVERHSRYVILLKLPNGHGAEAVRTAMTKRILTLPAQLAARSPGIRARDGRARPVHRRHRSEDLLLRPQEPLAAWKQREHQRIAPPIPAEVLRPLAVHPTRARRHRPLAQHPASTDPRLDDTISGVRRGRCVDPLRTHRIVDRGQRRLRSHANRNQATKSTTAAPTR